MLVGSVVFAADRKPDRDEQSTSTTKVAQQKANAQSQTSPILTASQTKASQTQSSAFQPVLTDAAVQLAQKAPLTGEQIKWQVVSGGGGHQSISTNYSMSSTAGQTAVGTISSASYNVHQGFWQNFSGGGGGCCASLSADGRTGNVDGDPGKGVDISDLSALIDFLYISFTPPPCMLSANVDGDIDDGVDISDLSALIDYLYISFTVPALCH